MPNTYTEKRPEYSLYVQDDFRTTDKLTLNLGLRWDVYPPWIEIDNRQSNFDESTGQFVVASDDAVINGVQVGRYLQTYSKRDFGPRFGFAYDLTGAGTTMIRGGFGVFWNFTPGGTSSSKAQNPPFLQSTSLNATPTAYGTNLLLRDGLPAAAGRRPDPSGRRHHAVDLRHQLPRRVCPPVERQCPAEPGHELPDRGCLRRLAGTADDDEGRSEPGAARGGCHRRQRQPALCDALAGAAPDRPGAEPGIRSTTTRSR